MDRTLCGPHSQSGHSGGKEKYPFFCQKSNPCHPTQYHHIDRTNPVHEGPAMHLENKV
jgi:hypothetical protein